MKHYEHTELVNIINSQVQSSNQTSNNQKRRWWFHKFPQKNTELTVTIPPCRSKWTNLHRSVVYPLQVDPTRDVCHTVALSFYIQKVYLKAKVESWTMQKHTIVPLKETKKAQSLWDWGSGWMGCGEKVYVCMAMQFFRKFQYVFWPLEFDCQILTQLRSTLVVK